jgi:hypothetical protein
MSSECYYDLEKRGRDMFSEGHLAYFLEFDLAGSGVAARCKQNGCLACFIF